MHTHNCISRLALTLAIALSATPFAASADVLTMPEADAEAPMPAATPRRGQTAEQVRAEFGEPVSVHGPIGDPPITRWTYADFVVTFEYDRVLSTLVPGRPSPIHHRDELQQRTP